MSEFKRLNEVYARSYKGYEEILKGRPLFYSQGTQKGTPTGLVAKTIDKKGDLICEGKVNHTIPNSQLNKYAIKIKGEKR